MLLNVQFENAM